MTEKGKKRFLNRLSDAEKRALEYNANFWLRENQRPPPGNWSTWAVIAGRGFGKTYTGTQWIRSMVEGKTPLAAGRARYIGLIAETAADARDVMVEGPAGILALSPPSFRPLYEPSKRRLTWANGAVATTFNATEPDQLRGPQHEIVWGDEFAKWKYARETWDQMKFGLRLGRNPRALLTTTPRPISILKKILRMKRTVSTRGSTFENQANLAESFIEEIEELYGGSRLGRQELDAEILDDTPGALWQLAMIEATRLEKEQAPDPEMIARRVIAVDPPATSGENADECGIVVATRDKRPSSHYYVEDDLSIGQASPGKWGRIVVNAYYSKECDRVVAESNNGGEMVSHVIHSIDPNVPVKLVTASRGKVARAEPVATLYEQGRAHHVGAFADLESQMCEITPDFDAKIAGFSPDRVDALVWAISELASRRGDKGITM